MSIWYRFCELMPLELLQWDFMKNALLAVLLMAPLFGILSTMVVTGRMSFFSDALGHSAFTGIAIGCIFGVTFPIWVAVIFSVVFTASGIMTWDNIFSVFPIVAMVASSVAFINSPPFVPMMVVAMKNKSVLIVGLGAGIIGYAAGNYFGVVMAKLLSLL